MLTIQIYKPHFASEIATMESSIARILGCAFRMLRTLGGAEMDVEPLTTSTGLAFFLREGVEALRLLSWAHPNATSAMQRAIALAPSPEPDTLEIAKLLARVVHEMEESLD